MRKILVFLLGLIVIVLLGVSYLRATNKSIPFLTPSYKVNNLNSEFALIAHAGGSLNIGNRTYASVTNTREAFEQSYGRGLRLFEVDLLFTTDGKLVAKHGWDNTMFGTKFSDKSGQSLTYKEVMSHPVYGKFHSIDTQGLISFLEKHPDAFLITDAKPSDDSNVYKVHQAIINEAKKMNNEHVLQRIIPQIYATNQYKNIKAMYPFPQILLTLYAARESEEKIQKFIENEPELLGIVISDEIFKQRKKLVNAAQAKNKKVFVHTIDNIERLKWYQKQGIDGVYTNHIKEYERYWLEQTTDTKEKK